MATNQFPPGWDEERVQRVMAHYETLTEDEAVVEDARAFKDRGRTLVQVPVELLPLIREIIAQHQAAARA